MSEGHLKWKAHCQKTMPWKKKKVGKKWVDMTSEEEWGSSGESEWISLYSVYFSLITL
jgi:hypothetical protein